MPVSCFFFQGTIAFEVEIQGSDQIFVSVPSPMTLLKCFNIRSRPAKIPVQLCEEDFVTCTLRKFALWQYLRRRTRVSKQLGLVSILQEIFAKRAVLKVWISLKPILPIPFGSVSFSMLTNTSSLFHHLHPTRNM